MNSPNVALYLRDKAERLRDKSLLFPENGKEEIKRAGPIFSFFSISVHDKSKYIIF